MATNTQKEFRKQMKALAKEGKVSKASTRRTVRFVEPRTIGLGAGTFLVIVLFNFISGLLSGVPVQPDGTYTSGVYELAIDIDQRESQLIQQMTAQVKAGEPFTSAQLTAIKGEINALRDQLPSIAEIEGAVSIENRQLDQIDVILMQVSEETITQKEKEAINTAITIYNGLNINSENPLELLD